jgi:hypothetical protein
MALFRNLGACPVECEAYSSGVNLRDCLCDVPMYASAQSLDFLDLANPAMAGLNWKLTLVPTIQRFIYGWVLAWVLVGLVASLMGLAGIISRKMVSI